MNYYGFTIEQISKFREEFIEELRNMKDSNGNPSFDKSFFDKFEGYSDESLAQMMQYNTPKEVAEMYAM